MQNLTAYIKNELNGLYPKSEIQSFVRIILSHVTGRAYALLMAQSSDVLSPSDRATAECIVRRLKDYEPIQYILGETEFMGLPFRVNQDTLIPRPETEELVECILNENQKSNPAVLDIGTGSGCIAIALARYMKNAEVSAWDFSEGALAVARENAVLNRGGVHFDCVDVLNEYPTGKRFDIIVSNPPYVMESEKQEMEDNVLRYEPHSALFVPDDKALIFYERIADIAKHILLLDGRLYFEINQAKGADMQDMLAGKGFCDIRLHKDISGCDRIVCASLKS